MDIENGGLPTGKGLCKLILILHPAYVPALRYLRPPEGSEDHKSDPRSLFSS